MNQTFKKGLALLTTLVMCICLLTATWVVADAAESDASAENKADFNTIVTSNANGDSKYTNTYTTTNGWTVTNSAIQTGGATVSNPQFPVIGPDNTHKAVCMNGKTSAPGKITSPTLTGGISKLTMKYTKMFTDTKLSATITVTDLATGTIYTQTVARDVAKDTDKYVVWDFEWVLETPITGDFTIVLVNDCPSGNTGNKDRMTVLELAWESAPKAVATSATIDFSVAANRTYFDSSKQVWQENGVTVTNEKTDTSTDIRDNVNPMRVYANTSVTIAYPGLNKLEVTCPTQSYAEALIAGVQAAYPNAEASFELTDPANKNANTIVTIVLAEASDSITFSVAKQTRFRNMTVYGQAGQTPAPECQHTNTTVEGAVDATCTVDGHTGKTVCVDCGETVSEGEVIGALGHNEVTDAAKDATCTEAGLTEGKHCDRCGETLVAQEEVAVLGHNEVTDAGKDATCTEAGLTEGKHCDRCGETLVAQEEVAALGHADENKDGLCDNCGVQCGEAVPPTGNNGILWTAVSFMLLSAVAIVMTMKKRQVA